MASTYNYCIKFEDKVKAIEQLSDEQRNIIDEVVARCVSGKKQVMGVSGAAGTGKTFMMKAMLEVMDCMGLDYTLAAPTNQAAMILQKATKKQANTIHTILRLRPDLQVIDLDMRDLKFCNPSWQFMTNIIIIDEASMVNEVLADYLTSRFKYVIAIYDGAQLRPVKDDTKSKLITQGTQFELTKIFRQGENNPLMKYFPILRKESIHKFKTDLDETGGLGISATSDISKFLIPVIKDMKQMIADKDYTRCRLASFTNERKKGLIDFMRKKLFNTTDPLVVGEFILFRGGALCDNMKQICNGDVAFVTNITPTTVSTIVGDFVALNVRFESYVGKGSVKIITDDNPEKLFTALAHEIEGRRLVAIEAKSKHQKANAWARYKQLVDQVNLMTPLDLPDGRRVKKAFLEYGYAMTVHSLQGITVDKVYVDIKDINRCSDDEMRQQLQYVALSRTRTKAVLYQ